MGAAPTLFIALLGSHSEQPQSRRLAQGLLAYRDRHRLDWMVHELSTQEQWRGPDLCRQHQGRLVLTGLVRDRDIVSWRERGGREPDVLLTASSRCTHPQAWIVHVDDEAIGLQAVDHLLRAGYRQLATWGAWQASPRRERFAAAARHAAACGVDLQHLVPVAKSPSAASGELAVKAMLDALPRPVGIITHQDLDAVFLRQFCAFHSFRVPEAVGIIGVDDGIPVCTSEAPQLSSVRVPWKVIGSRLGETAHRLLAGDGTVPRRQLLPAYGVSGRESTALHQQPTTDPLVAAFLKLLRSPSRSRDGVGAIATALGVHRGTLHRRVCAATGRGPQELVHDRRIERACELLRTSEATLDEIAQACGYGSRQLLHQAFIARQHVSPGAWRLG